jgi:hypothetical protein
MRANASAEVTRPLLNSGVLLKKGFPVVFHSIKGGERRAKHSPSYFNKYEASMVKEYCVRLTTDRERKTCECGLFHSFLAVYVPWSRPVGNWRNHTVQGSG